MMDDLAGLSVPPPDPRKVAIRRADASLEYETLAARVGVLARELRATPRSSVIGLRIGNEPAFIVSFLACLAAGRTAVVLDPLWTEMESRYALGQIDVSMLIVLEGDATCGPTACRLDPLGRLLSLPSPVRASERFDLSGIAVVHWSSGSTGKPRPIAVSRSALAFRITSLVEALSLRPDDRMLCFVPLSHCHGLDCIALPTIAARSELVLLDPRSATPERVLTEVVKRGITVFSAFPRFYDQLVQTEVRAGALSTIRLPLCGSAALSASTSRRFAQLFGSKIRSGYGLTEVGVLSMNRHEHEPTRYDSVGRMLPGIEWRMDETNDDGIGELWVRSPGCADSCLADIAADGGRLNDGWLRTGDLVRSDADGYLYIVGRINRTINVDGAKADPDEIEGVIATLPWIAECAVTRVADAEGIERIAAFVVPQPLAAIEYPEEAVRHHVAGRLSLYKVPTQVHLLAALPRNSLGKILYPELSAQLCSSDMASARETVTAKSDRARASTRTEAERTVARIWCSILRRDRVGVQENFTDLGGTSLHLVQLRERLREEFDRELTLVDLFRYPNVRSQAAFLSDSHPSKALAQPDGWRSQRPDTLRHKKHRRGR